MGAENTIFSKTLQALRKKQGVTQEQLASHLGVSPQAVSKWENGSYPEGDLLPKISDFFDVSISYLYGQEKDPVSIEQNVLDTMQEITNHVGESDGTHADYLDKMLDISWAFQIGCWKNNRNYYKRGIPEKGNRTASVITADAGFGFFNLNPERQFYTIIKEPDDGFAKNITVTEEIRDFFKLLGKPGALEILRYMLTLGFGECITVSNLAKKVGLSVEETTDLLEEAGKFKHQSESPFVCMNVLNSNGSEKGYAINHAIASLFIALLLTTDSLINTPQGYQMQVCSRGKSWFDRETVEKTVKKKDK